MKKEGAHARDVRRVELAAERRGAQNKAIDPAGQARRCTCALRQHLDDVRRRRGRVTASRAREKLYVGLSRARDLLVVCGDPEVIHPTGGEAVMHRLPR